MAFNDIYGAKFKSQFNLDSKFPVVIGVTKDSTGAALGGATVKSFITATNAFVAQTVADGSGNYRVGAPPSIAVFCVAYKAGSPDVAGTTVNTLLGVGGY